jgi:hypothetical protein
MEVGMRNRRNALLFSFAGAFLVLVLFIGVLLLSQHNRADRPAQLRASLSSSAQAGATSTSLAANGTQHATSNAKPGPTRSGVTPGRGAISTPTSSSSGREATSTPTYIVLGPGTTPTPTAASTPTPTAAPTPTSPANAHVIFSDNFSGTALSSAWTVINRHGEYAQSETECNVPGAVTVNNGLTISTSAQSATCGDFNLDGSVRHSPSSWPYTTGDVQWTSFAFTYGTVTYRAKFPNQGTSTWPAIWLLGSNCQATNIVTADTDYSTCPLLQAPGYVEMDLTECFGGVWCQLAMAQPSSWPECDYHIDDNWHTFSFVWTPSAISIAVDGQPTGCGFSAANGYAIPSTPMFLLIQTQTGGIGGTPNDTNLPTTLQVSSVTVTQP